MVKEKSKKIIKILILAIVLLVILSFVLTKLNIILLIEVSGESMEPSLYPKDKLVTIPNYKIQDISRGDIVVIKSPFEDKKYVKRIIGLPEDKIDLVDGKVFLNDELLEEDYIEARSKTLVYDKDSFEMSKDEVFVLGDNRKDFISMDSRYFGCIKIDDIISVVRFRYYPLGKGLGNIN